MPVTNRTCDFPWQTSLPPTPESCQLSYSSDPSAMSDPYYPSYDPSQEGEDAEFGWDPTMDLSSPQSEQGRPAWILPTGQTPDHQQQQQQQQQQVQQHHLPQQQVLLSQPHFIPTMPQGIHQEPWSALPQQFGGNPTPNASWFAQAPTMQMTYPQEQQQGQTPFSTYAAPTTQVTDNAAAGPSTYTNNTTHSDYLHPTRPERPRGRRAASFRSNESSIHSHSDASRSVSPNVSEMSSWGHRNGTGTWSCSYPGCTSRATFTRGCDLRKHYKRHMKTFFCRVEGCPQATEGGFSSKKDRARHEAKHNPGVTCEWEGCDRLFSRVDNMKDHVKRIHERKAS